MFLDNELSRDNNVNLLRVFENVGELRYLKILFNKNNWLHKIGPRLIKSLISTIKSLLNPKQSPRKRNIDYIIYSNKHTYIHAVVRQLAKKYREQSMDKDMYTGLP